MKTTLFIQIPAYNETKSLSSVINSLPQKIKGVDTIKTLVIDDGSSDDTSLIAQKCGVDYLLTHKRNLGLAKTFQDGLTFCLEHGADIIVNTDADNQYDQKEIKFLLQPILKKQADLVSGNRQIEKLSHMPISKKVGNQLGSWLIRKLTGMKIVDSSSGFRAYSRLAALSLNVYSRHTYTHETLIQAHYQGLTVVEVPVSFYKRQTGSSRLIASLFTHIRKSLVVIIRSILMYQAYTYLSLISGILISLGTLGFLRFLYFYFNGFGNGHIQSLILASMLVSLGFTTFVLGLVADLVSINRRLLEKKS